MTAEADANKLSPAGDSQAQAVAMTDSELQSCGAIARSSEPRSSGKQEIFEMVSQLLKAELRAGL